MKVFSATKQPSFLLNHPQEDFFLISNKYPIYAVADGVTLNIESGEHYPKKSGAFEVAKIFCQAAVAKAEKRYENFEAKNLKEVFVAGNRAVAEFNKLHGRTKDTVNYYDFDFFSATAALVLIKNKKVFWFSLCDSSVSLFNSKGERKFVSPGGWDYFPKNWIEEKNDKEKIIARHKDYRNAIDGNGKLNGYGVVDGEDRALAYLNFGSTEISQGELLFLYTDGFANYFDKEFVKLFKEWPEDLRDKLNTIVFEKSKTDFKKYGSEKTLIAISL